MVDRRTREVDASGPQLPDESRTSDAVETALQASTLIMLLHSQVSGVVVRENSDLTLVLSDGRELTVRGSGGEWDECWFLELPVDDIDRDEWSIVYDSEGCIAGKYPGSANA